MANCRCGEIAELRNNIGLIGQAKGKTLTGIEKMNACYVECNHIAAATNSIMDTERYRSAITGISEELREAGEMILQKLTVKETELNNRLSIATQEDTRYHEEQIELEMKRRAREREEQIKENGKPVFIKNK